MPDMKLKDVPMNMERGIKDIKAPTKPTKNDH